MTVLTEFHLPMTEELFFEEQAGALRRPSMQAAARAALARAQELAEPAMIYDWFPVTMLEGRRAQVGEEVFRLGRHADLLDQAESALLALVTAGPRIEAGSRELQATGKALDAYMLDAAGVFVVGLLIQEAHHTAERGAAERGWGVSAELAPGQLSGWGLPDQIIIGRMLGVEAIGVSVTASGILVPQKSASLLVGIGPGYEATEVRSPCEYCDVQETCRYRH